jgi:hypothetical protein
MTPDLFSPASNVVATRAAHSPAVLDQILTAQLIVAWAGERGDPPRLGWWRSDLSSEFGGEDLFRRLLPHTWPWATLQATREVARHHDANLRAQASNPDHLVTLYALGWDTDEQVDERLADHKRRAQPPIEALPGLAAVIDPADPKWSASRFETWVGQHGSANTTVTPAGRRLSGEPPSEPTSLVSQLIAALLPLSDKYPMPHFARRA